MLETEKVSIRWVGANRKYYESKGYKYTHHGDFFEVDIKDVSLNSHVEVKVRCDYCGKIITKKFQTYNQQHHEKFGDACKDCQPQKNKLCCLEKYGVTNGAKTKQSKEKTIRTSRERYGVDNPAQAKEAREKISKKSTENAQERLAKARITNLERYNTEHPFQNEEVKQKQKETLMKNYGVDHPKKSEEIKEKERQSNRQKYGVDYYQQTEEAKQRIRNTVREKYGYDYTLQVPEIRQKGMDTLLRNGNCPTSSQQLKLQEMLIQMYGKCELNKPCGTNFLDCVIEVSGISIDVEYDGKYWHQDKKRDRRRDEFVKSQGYKILRISAHKGLPSKEELSKAINDLVINSYRFKEINLDV